MIDSLAEPFKSKCELLIKKLVENKVPMRLFEARRSFKRSQELFAKGRNNVNGLMIVVDKKSVVTNARPGSSPHNWGVAADFVLVGEKPWDTSPESMKIWEQFGALVRDCELSWGGDWKDFKDLPHVEIKMWQRYRPSNWQSIVTNELKEV